MFECDGYSESAIDVLLTSRYASVTQSHPVSCWAAEAGADGDGDGGCGNGTVSATARDTTAGRLYNMHSRMYQMTDKVEQRTEQKHFSHQFTTLILAMCGLRHSTHIRELLISII